MSKYFLGVVAALSIYLGGIAKAEASSIYYYQGLNFTSVSGSAPQVTTSNHISGWVEFATAPTPNEIGKRDWIAYSLTDGSRTLSSATGDHQFFATDFFNFDPLLNITNWQFGVVPDSQPGNANIISTSNALDYSRLDAGLISDGRNAGGGTWITPAAAPVPEPASLMLLGTGLAGLVVRRYRRRNI